MTPRVETLKKRKHYLAAARARKWAAASIVVQGRQRGDEEDPGLVRVGFTTSKKVGNAVARNRARRRMRAVAAEVLPEEGRPGWDYVLIGRAGATAARPYDLLVGDLRTALSKLHDPNTRKTRR